MVDTEVGSAPAAEPPVVAATAPLRRLAAEAAAAEPDSLTRFRPTSVHHAVAGALFALPSPPTSFRELAVAAGITDSQFSTILEHPEACAWIVSRSASIAKFGLAAVYARLQHMALTSKNSNWALLFLRRFDPEFQRQSTPVAAVQINNFADYSDQELEAHLEQKRRVRFAAKKIIDSEAS